MITQQRLHELLHYDPTTGLFTWRVSHGCRKAGSTAGAVVERGYICIGLDKHVYRAHNLAWLYIHGVWPAGELDHKYGDTSDNRIANLRDSTHKENSSNRKLNKNNTTGYKGVMKRGNKYRAYIKVNYRRINLGSFPTASMASAAYEQAAARYFGEYVRDLVPIDPSPSERAIMERD